MFRLHCVILNNQVQSLLCDLGSFLLVLAKVHAPFALIGTQIRSSLGSCGTRSCWPKSSKVEPPSASGLLILFRKPQHVDRLLLYRFDSTAEMAKTIMSVTLAPRDLMLAKASWPGVSMKVISSAELSAWFLRGSADCLRDGSAPSSFANL
jgi:hypothetical protein